MGIRIDIMGAAKGLAERKLRTMYAAETISKAAAAKLEAAAKRDAPWTDRSGLVRQTIQGISGWEGDKIRTGVAGNMEYSPYLELTNDKRNAVLWPTIDKLKPEILQAMSKVVK